MINPQALELLVDGSDSRYTTPLNAAREWASELRLPAGPLLLNGMLFEGEAAYDAATPRHVRREVRRLQEVAAAGQKWGSNGLSAEAAAAQGYDGDDAAGWLAVATASPLLSQYFESVDGTGTTTYHADDAEKWADEQLLSRLDAIDAAAAAALRGPTAYEKRRAALRILGGRAAPAIVHAH